MVAELNEQGKSEVGVLATVTVSHLAQHFVIGISVLYPDIMVDLQLNYTQLGVMTGTTRVVAGFLQMLWSLLTRYASRRLLLSLGNILMAVGYLVVGRAHRFTELIGGNIVSASGSAAQHPVGTSIVADKYPQERVAGSLSIYYGLAFVGNIASPVLLSLIAVAMGWRYATYVLTILPLITSMTVLFYLRGDKAGARSIQDGEQANLWVDIKAAIRLRGAALIMAAQAFVVGGTGMGVIVTYTPLFLKNVLNVGSLETSGIYSVAVTGGVLGTLLFGRLARRIGNLRMAAVVVGTCSLLICLLPVYDTFHVFLIPHLFMIGAMSFVISSLLQAHLASIATPGQRDILIGLYFTLGFGISSIWTAVTGFIIDSYNSFTPAWLLMAILGAIAFILTMLASRQNSQRPVT